MDTNKPHYAFFTYIAKYLGVALIAGSVVHIGTLQNGVTRYVVLIGIGLILTIIGNIKEAKEHGQKINLNYFLIITGLSFATGFLSGGIQHYLDNPSYAGILLGIGIIITYVTFFLKDKFKIEKKNLAVVVILAILFMLFSHYVMDNTLLGEDHHGSESLQH
jgi:predicted PurR-regulated permease PerM